ncbi:MAG: HAD hydrolase-like protein [Gammaproteobacteria bacterium]|nr:HAD hydrolase-like protein [Gammaproteobacteria bacterium]
MFDCDGVLVDSERIANRVFARVLEEECGLKLSLEQMFDHFVGHSQAQCLEIIEQMTGVTPPPGLGERYRRDINAELADSVVAVSGIESVLETINTPYCVASGGSYEKMQTTLGKTGLAKYFDGNLFSVSEVERAKPFPDIYLHAALSMGVDNPEKCLVIDEIPLGVSGEWAEQMSFFVNSELMKAYKLLAAGANHPFNHKDNLTY